MPTTDLHTRLQRLRLQKLKRATPVVPPPSTSVAPPRARPAARAGEAAQLPGERVVTRLGDFQLIQSVYDLSFQHGPKRLADLFAHDAATAARLARDESLGAANLQALAFIDTETLRQYFLLDPGYEEALLTALVADLAPRAGWVTFNGRAFDLPLLETRLTLNQQRGALGQRPHLDLLTPARRLYRGRLPSCSLGDIERGIFRISRDEDDVPGWLIPQMYLDYLRTGDPGEMRRVIYHNTIDILSMVTLAAHLMDVFATPLGIQTAAKAGRRASVPASGPSPEDLLRLACWHADNNRPAEAEAAFKRALAARLGLDDRRLGLTRLAALLKRQDRRIEAVPVWEQLTSFTLDDPQAFVELAMYYEWHARDLPRALEWTDRALSVVAGWPAGWRRDLATGELQRRRDRLQAKRQTVP
jgi:tetratricopeptide (TPR) repeat protein